MWIKRWTIGLMVLLLVGLPLQAFAHGGGTDSFGGHKDNNNVSGLGSYHYHHEIGPHLHPDGICPFAPKLKSTPAPVTRSVDVSEETVTPKPQPTVALSVITHTPTTELPQESETIAKETTKEEDKSSGGGALVALLAIGGAIWWVFKKKKKA